MWAALSFIHLPPSPPICVPPHPPAMPPQAGAASLPCLPGAAEHCPGNSPQGIMKAAQLKWQRSKPRRCFHPPSRGEREQEEPSLLSLPLDNVPLLW